MRYNQYAKEGKVSATMLGQIPTHNVAKARR
jgi:hypothetical protein